MQLFFLSVRIEVCRNFLNTSHVRSWTERRNVRWTRFWKRHGRGMERAILVISKLIWDPITRGFAGGLSVYLLFTSVSTQQLPSSMLPQIHRHCSSFRKSPSSRGCFSNQLIATTGARCGVCLDFCFTLILCFLFAPSVINVEISSSILESTTACVSLIKKSDTGQAYLVMILIIVITTLNSGGRRNYCWNAGILNTRWSSGIRRNCCSDVV